MIVTFVLLAHNEEYDYLVSLGSLMCQTNPNWKAIVFHNGPNRTLQAQVERIFADKRISYFETPEDNGTDTINRETAYIALVDTEWVVSTSIQDYYLPKTVDEIGKVCAGADFIYWNSMNNHWLDNQIMDCQPEKRKIDWGNFAIRTDLAKRIPITHRHDMADGLFVEEVMKTKVRKVKIEKMLTIHN